MNKKEAPKPPLKQPSGDWRKEHVKLELTDRSTPVTSTREVITWKIN